MDSPQEYETLHRFEGQEIDKFEVVLPRITVDALKGFSRQRILRLNCHVRVVDVSFPTDGSGNLVRRHVLEFDGVEVVSETDPSQDRSIVGGSLSTNAPGGEVEGVEFGRTSEADAVDRLSA